MTRHAPIQVWVRIEKCPTNEVKSDGWVPRPGDVARYLKNQIRFESDNGWMVTEILGDSKKYPVVLDDDADKTIREIISAAYHEPVPPGMDTIEAVKQISQDYLIYKKRFLEESQLRRAMQQTSNWFAAPDWACENCGKEMGTSDSQPGMQICDNCGFTRGFR